MKQIVIKKNGREVFTINNTDGKYSLVISTEGVATVRREGARRSAHAFAHGSWDEAYDEYEL